MSTEAAEGKCMRMGLKCGYNVLSEKPLGEKTYLGLGLRNCFIFNWSGDQYATKPTWERQRKMSARETRKMTRKRRERGHSCPLLDITR